MSVPVIIIIGGPRPNGRTAQTEHEFDSIESAITFLQNQPPEDELPAGDGSAES